MDDYIKRKSKININYQPNKGVGQNTQQIVLRQSQQQIDDFLLKIQFMYKRLGQIKKRIQQSKIMLLKQHSQNKQLLVSTSSQRSQIKDPLSDRKTPESIQNISTDLKLEGSTQLAGKRNDQLPITQQDQFIDDKLSQSGKITKKTRKIRKGV